MNANDQSFIERLCAECDALKASNAELRKQLAANTKLISELQHTTRLAQGTHVQQVRECAVKAFAALEGGKWFGDHRSSFTGHKDAIVGIICEAFGAPVKDECTEALETEWRRMELAGELHQVTFDGFKNGFHAAWTLAKGKP